MTETEPTDHEVLLAIFDEVRTIKRVALGFALAGVLWLVLVVFYVVAIAASRPGR